jgi:UDP-N-acetylmuramate dehydrogenase
VNKDFCRFLKDGKIEFFLNEDLTKKSHIGIGGFADVITPKNEPQLLKLLGYVHRNKVPYKVIGALSNTLICGGTFTEVVIDTAKIVRYTLAETKICCESGAKITSLSRELARSGIEFFPELAGIPGTVGGMICSNAGAFGASVSDRFLYADIYDISEDKVFRFDKHQMNFAYRDSILKHKNGLVLLNATFRIARAPAHVVMQKIEKAAFFRRDTQPIGTKSLGSTFKRANTVVASSLIDSAGFKGLRVGDAAVSHKHAGFIVNLGNASAQNVIDLIELIKNRIYTEFGVSLEEEIEIWRDCNVILKRAEA